MTNLFPLLSPHPGRSVSSLPLLPHPVFHRPSRILFSFTHIILYCHCPVHPSLETLHFNYYLLLRPTPSPHPPRPPKKTTITFTHLLPYLLRPLSQVQEQMFLRHCNVPVRCYSRFTTQRQLNYVMISRQTMIQCFIFCSHLLLHTNASL